jgi:hypothetical protein
LPVILPQPKKALSQWIENLSMSALAIMHQVTSKQRPPYPRGPDRLPKNIVFGDYSGVNEQTFNRMLMPRAIETVKELTPAS